ncbi:MAG: putative rhamnosyl transferase [Pseudomonadota bacterium]|jgi:GT2 family glycosyltransferase
MKRLLYVAVVYNNVEETRDMCCSLLRQTPGNYEISLVLVDNSDARLVQLEIDKMATDFAFVSILRPNKNLGYFPAISEALSLYALDYDVVIAGNNDLKYAEDFSFTLSNATYEDDVMVVCPDVVTADGFHQNPHHKFRLNLLEKIYFDIYFSHYICSVVVGKLKKTISFFAKLFKHSTLSIRGEGISQEIDQGVGAVYVFRRRFLVDIDCKLHYPGFLYGEEACLSWQVRSNGGKIWYDPSLKVWHAESASLSKVNKATTYCYGRDSYWKIRDLL